jgi:hypothetical protein
MGSLLEESPTQWAQPRKKPNPHELRLRKDLSPRGLNLEGEPNAMGLALEKSSTSESFLSTTRDLFIDSIHFGSYFPYIFRCIKVL